MSSTLYGRGTLLQTGSRERAERVDQQLTELRTVLRQTLEELKAVRAENAELSRQIKHIHAVTGIPVASAPHLPTANT
jgi:hypothetical protein